MVCSTVCIVCSMTHNSVFYNKILNTHFLELVFRNVDFRQILVFWEGGFEVWNVFFKLLFWEHRRFGGELFWRVFTSPPKHWHPTIPSVGTNSPECTMEPCFPGEPMLEEDDMETSVNFGGMNLLRPGKTGERSVFCRSSGFIPRGRGGGVYTLRLEMYTSSWVFIHRGGDLYTELGIFGDLYTE